MNVCDAYAPHRLARGRAFRRIAAAAAPPLLCATPRLPSRAAARTTLSARCCCFTSCIRDDAAAAAAKLSRRRRSATRTARRRRPLARAARGCCSSTTPLAEAFLAFAHAAQRLLPNTHSLANTKRDGVEQSSESLERIRFVCFFICCATCRKCFFVSHAASVTGKQLVVCVCVSSVCCALRARVKQKKARGTQVKQASKAKKGGSARQSSSQGQGNVPMVEGGVEKHQLRRVSCFVVMWRTWRRRKAISDTALLLGRVQGGLRKAEANEAA